jgi:peptidoglycan hydrolase-like protein with peptidoglycan-binding domain
MRRVIVAVAGLLAFVSSAPVQAQNSGGPVPLVQLPTSGATGGGGARRIVGDEGIMCARAFEAPTSDLAAVIKACSKIQAKQPTTADRARVLRYRGVAEQRNGDFTAAVADLDIVLRLTPDDWRALKYRAQAHEALGHRQEAIADYQRLAVMRPGDTVWRVKIAELGAVPPVPTPPVATALATPELADDAKPEPAKTRAAEAPATGDPATGDLAATLRKLQAALRELGYDVGAVNGLLGAKTRQALDAFAADLGLPKGGEPSPQYLAAAEEELALRRATAAAEQQELNRRIQQALADLGYYEGDIDGAFGPMSRRALESWLAESGRQSGVAVDDVLAQSLEAAVLAQLMLSRPTPAVAAAPARIPPPITPEAAEPAVVALATPTEPSPQRVTPAPAVEPPQVQAPPPAAAEPAVVRSGGPYEIVAAKVEMPEKRVALVIGNGGYEAVTALPNPKNDAEDITVVLSELGFEVLRGIDLSRDNMTRITKDFARKARTADIAMTYYSGHGLQFEGINYLVPVDVHIQDEYDVREMVQLSQVIQDAGQAQKLAMVVVDACRDNPLAKKVLAESLGASRSASLGEGLGVPKLPEAQSLVAYATAADFVAYDGASDGRNSPFTAALLQSIKTPKLDVRQLFGKVADQVRRETGNRQRPDMWANLGGDPIFLVPGPPEPVGLAMTELTASELQVIQRSLKWLKLYDGAEDGVATPELSGAVQIWQGWQGAEQSGRLTPQQVIGLYTFAARDRPREPLPEVKIEEVMGKLGQGDLAAQRTMGMMFDPAFAKGPFDKNRGTAQSWYATAAAQSDVEAAALLGKLLSAPDNPQADREEALKWLEKAADAGDPGAALRYAELLLERQVDTAASSKAVKLLQVAAVNKDTRGIANLLLRKAGEEPVIR